MFSFIALLCTLEGSCMITGPQTQFFNTKEDCETFATRSMLELDLTKINATYQCIPWGKPV